MRFVFTMLRGEISTESSALLAAYLLLLLLRAVVLFTQSSFIHPDEHFQCGQVAARLHLGYSTIPLPWEYEPGNAARSYLPVELLCGVPFFTWRQIAGDTADIRGGLVLLKLWSFLLSLLGDALVVIIAKQVKLDWQWILLLRSSSWAGFAFSTKTFSNVLEGLLLDLLMVALFAIKTPVLKAVLGGFIVGIGSFTRITFPAFAAAVVLEALRREYVGLSKKHDRSFPGIATGLCKFGFSAVAGLSLAVSSCVALDSFFNGGFVIGPLANLLYNVNEENLAKHGLHPRWTHAIVNLQLLFGPLGLLALFSLIRKPLPTDMGFLYGLVILSLSGLSVFPHQEFRFLYPLFTPLVLLAGSYLRKRWILIFWIIFNIALGIIFGAAHQGGISNAVLQAGRLCHELRKGESCCLASQKVYSVPEYLLGNDSLRFRVKNFGDEPIPSNFFNNCHLALTLGPSKTVQNDNARQDEVWRYRGLHFNAEAGGFTDLVLSKKRM